LPETCIQGKHTIPNQAFINAAKQERKQKIFIFELNIVIIIIIMPKHTIQSLLDKKQETANTATIAGVSDYHQ
jgi:t-SNARE complex subunit (syntaxin)